MTNEWYQPPSDLWGKLSDSARSELLDLGQTREYGKGEHVFQAGSPGLHIYLLLDGRAKIYKLSDSGKEVILWFCLPGEIFGLTDVVLGTPREVSAQMCTAARVYQVPRVAFNRFLVEHPVIALQVIDLLSCRLRVLGDMLLNLTADDVTSRIIKLMLRLCNRYGQNAQSDANIEVSIPLTHQEIADMVGATRQTVSSTISQLTRKGILRMRNRHLCIHSQELLNHMLNQPQDAEAVQARSH